MTVAVNSDAVIYQRTPHLQKIMDHKGNTKPTFSEEHTLFNGKEQFYLLLVYEPIIQT
jgi:hypothetical protein